MGGAAFSGSGLSVLVTDRLADDATVVVAVAEGSAVSGSAVVEVAVTVLERTVPAATDGETATVSVKTALPTANDGLEHETVAPVVHDQPATAGSETKVVPAGSVSLHEVLAAASGPLLVTVMV